MWTTPSCMTACAGLRKAGPRGSSSTRKPGGRSSYPSGPRGEPFRQSADGRDPSRRGPRRHRHGGRDAGLLPCGHMKRRDWGKGVGVDVLEHPPRTVLVIRGKKKFTPTEGDVRPTGLRPTPPLADARVRIHEFEPDPRVLAEGGLDQGGIPPALSCRDCPVDWHLPRSQGHRNGELLKRRVSSLPPPPEH